MKRGSQLPPHIHRHVAAARAFHTDLIAHAQRRLQLLMKVAKHLDVLRSHNSTLAEKVSAAESSRKHLEMLDQLGRSWRATYADLRTAVKRIHHHLNLLTAGRLRAGKLRVRREELAVPSAQRAAGDDATTHVRTARSGNKNQPSMARSGTAGRGLY